MSRFRAAWVVQGPSGVGSDSGQVHPSGVDLDEEQHMETAQGDGVDTEEVGRDWGVGLAGDELAPRGSGSGWACVPASRRIFDSVDAA